MSLKIKTRVFLMDAGKLPDNIDTELTRIKNLPGIIDASFKGNKLIVKYNLYQCRYDHVKAQLAETLSLIEESGINKWKTNWLRFTEENEYENLCMPAGWQHYVQNLYLTLPAKKRKIM